MNWMIEPELLYEKTRMISIGGLPLSSELSKITKFRNSEAPEIIAFYAGRIIESMVSLAITRHQLPPGDGKVSTELDILSSFGLIDEGTLSVAHAIRRYGNQVRHLERVIQPDEEGTVIGLLQLWIEWFERTVFTYQPNVLALSGRQWSEKTALLRQLAYPEAEDFDNFIRQNEQREALLAEAAIAEFAAERLVDFRSPFADEFTSAVITRFPKSIRAKQMRALFFSRNGNPDGAIVILSRLLKNHFRNPDRETFGILAGAYKNKWIQTAEADQLDSAHLYYQQGADYYPKDYYLRINLAATSLWKGDQSQSRSHAHSSLQSLSDSGFVINTGDQCDKFDYWIVATIAEANLLAGKAKRAAYLYEQARSLDASGGRWERTSQQLSLHLKFIGDPNSLQHFTSLVSQ